MRSVLLVMALAASTPALAQTSTVQQRFDAARARLDADDPSGALAELQALEVYLQAQPTPNQTNLAITRAQQSEALEQLGRGSDARAAAQAALASGRLDKPELKPIRDNIRLTLARIKEAELDHSAAAAEYLRIAADIAEPMTRTVALMGAARTMMFTDAAAALTHADAALVLAESNPAIGKKELANVLGLKGRILLNGGRNAEAKAALARAVSLRGGLTQKVYQSDVSLRADAAIAMLRLGLAEEARRYLAYTGAGRTEVQLNPPVEMPLPPCGGEAGLRPEDWAVIEFTILSDGRVVAARPVFSSRPGEAAYLFARTVERWSWDPDNAAKVKPFYRLATRVELRCTNKSERPRPTFAFEDEAQQWFSRHGLKPLAAESGAARAVELERRLKTAPADSPERLGTLMWLARNRTVHEKQRLQHATDALRLAERIGAPPPLRFLIALDHANAAAEASADGYRSRVTRRLAALQALRSRPEFADAQRQATLNLEIADLAAYLKRGDEEQAALLRVANVPALSDKHPLKVAALVELANLYAAAKQKEQAAAMYARTGLSAQQCALLDDGPTLLASGHGSFPMEAFNWGFEGWTSLEYDVAADGKPLNARAVAAFPPKVFAKASEDIARTMRYRVSYRPEGNLACTAMSRRVSFAIH